MLGLTQLWQWNVAAARNAVAAARDHARAQGLVWLGLRCVTYRAFVQRVQEEAIDTALLDQAEALGAELGIGAYGAVARAHRACAALRRGDRQTAKAMAAECREAWTGARPPYPFEWCAVLVQLAAAQPDDVATQEACLEVQRRPSQHRLPAAEDGALGEGNVAAAVAAAKGCGLV